MKVKNVEYSKILNVFFIFDRSEVNKDLYAAYIFYTNFF